MNVVSDHSGSYETCVASKLKLEQANFVINNNNVEDGD